MSVTQFDTELLLQTLVQRSALCGPSHTDPLPSTSSLLSGPMSCAHLRTTLQTLSPESLLSFTLKSCNITVYTVGYNIFSVAKRQLLSDIAGGGSGVLSVFRGAGGIIPFTVK